MNLRKTTSSRKRARQDRRRLFYGDNLDVMRRFVKDESVDLCYMDPPFNSQRTYNQIYDDVTEDRAQAQAFVDTWKWDDHARSGHRELIANERGRFPTQLVDTIRGLHKVLGEQSLFSYLVGMALRFVEIRRSLKPTGSFYIHCDPTASHYLKIVLDAVFGLECFANEIVWERTVPKSLMSRRFPTNHDVLLVYGKTDRPKWNRDAAFRQYDLSALDEKTLQKYSARDVDGRRYQLTSLLNPNPDRPNLTYEFMGVTRTWRWTRERMQAAAAAGLIVQTKPGSPPRLKRYLDEQKGKPIGDVWTDIPPVNSQAAERLGYPTQKPLALLKRVILSSTDENDVVFDPCCGCGTTIAAAESINRRWMGIDITYQSISLILQRLEDEFGPDILDTVELNGVPRDMASAVALAHKKDDRVRKEFEKWAVLTYTNNRAVINEKKGADGGIDGRVSFLTSQTASATMVVQVKSGIVGRGDVSQLRGDMEGEGAAMATLITLSPPTAPMIAEAKKAGFYEHELMGRKYNRIEIVSVQEILEEDKRLDLPLVKDVAKHRVRDNATQPTLPGIDEPLEAPPPEPDDLLAWMKRKVAGDDGGNVAKRPQGKTRGRPSRKTIESDESS